MTSGMSIAFSWFIYKTVNQESTSNIFFQLSHFQMPDNSFWYCYHEEPYGASGTNSSVIHIEVTFKAVGGEFTKG